MAWAAFVDPEFEADDIIGTLSCLMRAQGIRSAFITRDKDMAQLVRDGDLLWDFGARTQLGYRDVAGYFGVAPEGFADFLALTGDASDNIPGVPGIGPKIAATLMRKFGSLDELYANVGRVAALGLRGGGALGERLAAHRESVFLARRLTRIVCDMPLGVSASDLRPRLRILRLCARSMTASASDRCCAARASDSRSSAALAPRQSRHRDASRRRRWRSPEQKPRFLLGARWAGQEPGSSASTS